MSSATIEKPAQLDDEIAVDDGAAHARSTQTSRILSFVHSKLDLVGVLYLTVPLLLFLGRSFKPLPAVVLVALALAGLYPLLKSVAKIGPPGRLTISTLVLSGAVVGFWVALGGSGHLFFGNSDWIKHDSVYADLTRMAWPPTYINNDGSHIVLRYYEAYYLVPATLAKYLGHHNLLMEGWTTLGVWLVTLRVLAVVPRLNMRMLVLVTFILFGGLDIIGWLVVQGPSKLHWIQQVDGWNLKPSKTGFSMVQFPSMTTLVFWVPQHGISGWLATLLVIERKDKAFVLGLPILIAAVAFWSAFCALGLLPLAAVVIYRYLKANSVRTLITPSVIAALVVAATMAIFLLGGSEENQHGFVWQLTPPLGAILRLLLFLVLELGVMTVTMRIAGVRFGTFQKVAICFLIPLSTYNFGAWGDLTMRASIPGLFVIFLGLRDWMAERRPTWKPRWRTVPLIIALIGGSYAAVPQFYAAFDLDRTTKSQNETDDVLQMLAYTPPDIPVGQYLVDGPPILEPLMRNNGARYVTSPRPASLQSQDWTQSLVNDFSGGTDINDAKGQLVLTPGPSGSMDLNTKTHFPTGIYQMSMNACLNGPSTAKTRLGFGVETDESRRIIPPDKNGCFSATYYAFIDDVNGRYLYFSPRDLPPGTSVIIKNFSLLAVDRIPTATTSK